jgi:membrane protein implicated in regulation of membrane protease activity
MKPTISSALSRAALCLPALSLMLAPLAAHAKERADTESRTQTQQLGEQGVGGRGGIIEEFNLGPTGMDVIKQRENPADEEGNRTLSGRVVELKGRTLYVEREGVVVPLDLSALRVNKEPKPGQEIIATYAVDQTSNIARSLAGEVLEPQ